uniref:Uncharacterized protein n=1 Tax=Sphaerodactylus townsendi TaxID=933632 RepID=A0ACB8G3J8_9SAUR
MASDASVNDRREPCAFGLRLSICFLNPLSSRVKRPNFARLRLRHRALSGPVRMMKLQIWSLSKECQRSAGPSKGEHFGLLLYQVLEKELLAFLNMLRLNRYPGPSSPFVGFAQKPQVAAVETDEGCSVAQHVHRNGL